MNVFVDCVLAACGVGMVALGYFGVRNNRVYRYRLRLLQQVSIAAQNDIWVRHVPWEWRYNILNRVTYNEMVFSFKKLTASSYWNDLKFLEDK